MVNPVVNILEKKMESNKEIPVIKCKSCLKKIKDRTLFCQTCNFNLCFSCFKKILYKEI